MGSNVEVNLTARISDFETALGRANGIFENFASKGASVNNTLKKGFKELADAGKHSVDELQKQFNSFGVKSDLAIKFNMKYVEESKAYVTKMFADFRKDGAQTGAEMAASFRQFQLMLANIDASVLSSEFKQLGIQSAASIEVMKQKTIAAFEEIERVGTKYPQDIVRAREAMNAELARLDNMLLSQEEKNNAERLRSEKAMLDEAYRMNEKFVADKTRLMREQQAMYAQQAMSEPSAAPKLLGQQLAGSSFSSQLKSQMEEAAKPAKELKTVLDSMEGKNAMESHTKGMSAFSFATIGMIVKIQLFYSTINIAMSAIGSLPKTAIDSIENFNASVISNTALITSMQGKVENVGKAYSENKKYAEAVQEVLVKMDAETSASAANLTDMNRAYVAQGVILDTNNAKQIEGFKNTANAIAALTHGAPNANLQYTQEVASMLKGEDKSGNALFKTLNALDNGQLAEHLKLWKQTGIEIGNNGYILEKIGPLLQGFAAAQGDINSLWETTKSTLTTIRDEVLRGGLSEGFAEIVKFMKEIGQKAEENKEKIQAFLRDGFKEAKNIASMMFNIGKAVSYVSEPLMWAAITTGIYSAVKAMSAFVAEMTLASGGMNLLVAGAVSLGLYAGKKMANYVELNEEATTINKRSQAVKPELPAISGEQLAYIKSQLPGASTDALIKANINGVFKVENKLDTLNKELNGPVTKANRESVGVTIDRHRYNSINMPDPVKPPKIKTGGDTGSGTENVSQFNEIIEKWNTLNVKAEPDEFKRKLAAINKEFSDLSTMMEHASKTELNDLAKKGITPKGIAELKDENVARVNQEREEATEKAKLATFKAFTANRIESIKQANALEQVILTDNYNEGLISLQTYLDKRHKFEEDSIQGEIDAQKALIEESMSAVADVVNKGGSELEYEQARKKAAESTKVLIALEGKLRTERVKNGIETKNALQEESQRIGNISIKLMELAGNYHEAAAAKIRLYQESDEYKKLSPEAKAAKDEELIIEQGLANNKSNKYKTDTKFSDFGVDNRYAGMVDKYAGMYDKLSDIEAKHGKWSEEYQNTAWGNKVDMARSGMSLLTGEMLKGSKRQFEIGKKLAMAMVGVDAGMAIVKTMASVPWPMNLVASGIVGLAAAVEAAKIDSQQYEGRELGGPVLAGKTYIVGEKRPELFTPGASGVITPYVPEGGGKTDVTNVFQISTGVSDTVRAEIARVVPAIVNASVSAVKSAMRSGDFQGVTA